jgi:AbrB family looped-hinge helix DNA binding protein
MGFRIRAGAEAGVRVINRAAPPQAYAVWYCDGMKTTIDKAGRVVIPAAVRERMGLNAGTTLEITLDETGIRLAPVAPGPRLVRVGRRLVARATATSETRPALDVAALIEEERNRWP